MLVHLTSPDGRKVKCVAEDAAIISGYALEMNELAFRRKVELLRTNRISINGQVIEPCLVEGVEQ